MENKYLYSFVLTLSSKTGVVKKEITGYILANDFGDAEKFLDELYENECIINKLEFLQSMEEFCTK